MSLSLRICVGITSEKGIMQYDYRINLEVLVSSICDIALMKVNEVTVAVLQVMLLFIFILIFT